MINETNIANRALQHCGAERIATGLLWTEDSKNASEIREAYDIVRQSEIRRNVWRYSIRTQVLRPLDTTTRYVTFPAWSALVNYAINDIVSVSGKIWISVAAGINKNPTNRTFDFWTNYFGNVVANLYTVTVTYMAGEIVYSGVDVYISLQNNNLNNVLTDVAFWQKLTANAWSAVTAYVVGNRVISGGIVYACIANNTNQVPPNATFWTAITQATLASNAFIYPIGAGPSSNTQLRNVYRLPNGFVREAPQSPKQGSYTLMGAPSGLPYTDWQYEGNFFTTMQVGAIALRFAADIENPNDMDPMFVDGFSARLGFEVVETITQSDGKKKTIAAAYNKFMSDARTVNGIETGAVEQPEDSYISLRY